MFSYQYHLLTLTIFFTKVYIIYTLSIDNADCIIGGADFKILTQNIDFEKHKMKPIYRNTFSTISCMSVYLFNSALNLLLSHFV